MGFPIGISGPSSAPTRRPRSGPRSPRPRVWAPGSATRPRSTCAPADPAQLTWTTGDQAEMRIERVEEPSVFGFTWHPAWPVRRRSAPHLRRVHRRTGRRGHPADDGRVRLRPAVAGRPPAGLRGQHPGLGPRAGRAGRLPRAADRQRRRPACHNPQQQEKTVMKDENAPSQPTTVDRPPSRPSSTGCGSGRRHTPGKATRSPRPAAGCPWSRSTPTSSSSDRTARSPCSTRSKDAGSSSPTTSCGTPATPQPSSAKAARGATPRSRSCPTCIRATSPTPSSARVPTRKAPLPRLHGLEHAVVLGGALARRAPRRTPDRHDAPRLLPPGRRPRLRDLLDDLPRRRGDGLQLRADGPHRLRAPGAVGGLAPRLAPGGRSTAPTRGSTDAPLPSGRGSKQDAPTTSPSGPDRR